MSIYLLKMMWYLNFGHSEMEENASDTGKDIVRTTRKPGRPPKGTGK